jgi:hypothetical protein
MRRRILLLSIISLLQFLLVHFLLIQRFPNSGDEEAYLFQTRMFSQGRLYVEDPIYDREHPLNKFIEEDAVDDASGRRFSKYDPGWALFLAPFARLKIEWLAGPLLGAFTVFLLLSHVSKRIGNDFVAPTWWLITLCSFFSLSVANFGNHTVTMATLLGVFILYDATRDLPGEQGRWRLFGIGLLLAYCSLVRYLDWIPLMIVISVDLLRQRKIKQLVLVFLGFGLLASFHLLYNKMLTGSAWRPPAVDDAQRKGRSVEAALGVSWLTFKVTGIRLLRALYAFPPVALLLLCLVKRCRSAVLKSCLVVCGLCVGVYMLYAFAPAGPGPRYYLPFFPFLFLAVIEVYRLNRDRKLVRFAWRVAIVALVLCSSVYAVDQTIEIYRRKDLDRAVVGIPESKKIILLETGTYKMGIPDLVRNPPNLWSANTLYFAYADGIGLDELLRRFPQHAVYLYRYPGSLKRWKD